MKKLAALILTVVMVLPLVCVGASAAEVDNKGFKVYPFEAFALNSCKLDMTPDGAYTFTRNDAVNDTTGFISFMASNFTTLDYDAMDYLYLNTGDSVMDFTVKAEFHNSLDGYFYPSVVVYASGVETKANSTIKIPYRQLLQEAGKWEPAGKYLGISIQFTHNGDASKKLKFQSIWLGNASIDTEEKSGVNAAEFDLAEPTFIGNATCEAVSGYEGRNAYSLTKEVNIQEGYVVKDLAQGSRIDTPYLYINVLQLPAYTTPNLFVKDPDNILTYVRIRPEMAGSNIWLRLDLRNYPNGTAALKSDTLILRTHNSFTSAGAAPLTPIVFGMYYGGEVFTANTAANPGGDGNPKTGDTLNMVLAFLMAASAAGVVVARKKT